MIELKSHPLADLFPLMEGAEFERLVADIKDNGLRDPIILHDGLILDGRNRYRACCEANVKPTVKEWDGLGTAEAFVISKNLNRRHLNESQRAMIAGKLANLPTGKRADLAQKNQGGEISPPSISLGQAAEMLNVHRSSAVAAKTVLQKGTPEEIKAVEKGETAVSTVAKLIRKGVEPEQRKAVIIRGWTDIRGRKMPERPSAECMERGIDQLNNALDALDKILERPDATGHGDFADWLSALEGSRTTLSRLINRCRERRAA